jgi:hypothetical protein
VTVTRRSFPSSQIGRWDFARARRYRRGGGQRLAVRSQSLSVQSLLPDSALRPSGENATDQTTPACGESVDLFSGCDVPEFDGPVLAAGEHVAAIRREGDRSDVFRVPVKGGTSFPVATSQSFNVPLLLPEIAARPSDKNATEWTIASCPANARISFPVPAFHSLIVLS